MPLFAGSELTVLASGAMSGLEGTDYQSSDE